MKNSGILCGVGVGPGDPELLTIKALRILRSADVIAIPVSDSGSSTAYSIACQAEPELAKKPSCRLTFPMTRDAGKRREYLAQNADNLIRLLDEGKAVAFPVLGDPSVYSTYTYISSELQRRGYQTEMIPGVTSFCAAAAAAGRSLAEDSMPIHISPAIRQPEGIHVGPDAELSAASESPRISSADASGLNAENSAVHEALQTPSVNVTDFQRHLSKILSQPGAKVLMKGGRNSGQIRDLLLAQGASAVMVENCGMPEEHVYLSPEDFPDQAGYYSTILIRGAGTTDT